MPTPQNLVSTGNKKKEPEGSDLNFFKSAASGSPSPKLTVNGCRCGTQFFPPFSDRKIRIYEMRKG